MFCPRCGNNVSDQASFCERCGFSLRSILTEPSVSQSVIVSSAPTPFIAQSSLSQAQAMPVTVNYAGFWVRLVAATIDAVIINLVSFVLIVIAIFIYAFTGYMSGFLETEEVPGAFVYFGYLIGGVVSWFYYALLESTSAQATFGKRVLGLKVTRLDGQKLSFGRATLRYLGRIVSSFLTIGFLIIALNEKKQGLHDMIAGTLVVKK